MPCFSLHAPVIRLRLFKKRYFAARERGYKDGYAAGLKEGEKKHSGEYSKGYDEGYDRASKDHENDWWDGYQRGYDDREAEGWNQSSGSRSYSGGSRSYNSDPIAQTYIGNKNTHKFHLPTCSSLPAQKNQVIFESREDAINAGYVPCGRCNP